ncbi:Cytochrome b reductase 1, partial [Fagus crenata]
CLPIKAIHELGSERREIAQSISGVGIRALRRPFPSMREPRRKHLWFTSYRAHGKRWVAKCEMDN